MLFYSFNLPSVNSLLVCGLRYFFKFTKKKRIKSFEPYSPPAFLPFVSVGLTVIGLCSGKITEINPHSSSLE